MLFCYFLIFNLLIFLIYCIYLIFAILGVAISPLFFAFHLFQVRNRPHPLFPFYNSLFTFCSQLVFRSRHLYIVLRAITMNATKLLLMGLLMLCVLYFYGIVNWKWFSMLLDSPGSYCETVLGCLLTNMYLGYVHTKHFYIYI